MQAAWRLPVSGRSFGRLPMSAVHPMRTLPLRYERQHMLYTRPTMFEPLRKIAYLQRIVVISLSWPLGGPPISLVLPSKREPQLRRNGIVETANIRLLVAKAFHRVVGAFSFSSGSLY